MSEYDRDRAEWAAKELPVDEWRAFLRSLFDPDELDLDEPEEEDL
ncbi:MULTISPECIES: hypothetical protein [unclassified Microbacterium]